MYSNGLLLLADDKEEKLQTLKALSPHMKKLSDNFEANLMEYKHQKDENNQFLSLYKRYNAIQKKKREFTCNSPFDELFNEYIKRRHPYPKNALNGNIFKKDPLLIVSPQELEQFYRKQKKGDMMKEYLKEKSINKLNHFELLAVRKAKKLAETSDTHVNYFDIISKRMPHDNSKDLLYDKRDLMKLNQERMLAEKDIAVVNNLIAVNVFRDIEPPSISDYVIRPKQSIIDEPNNIIKHFSQKSLLSDRSHKGSTSNQWFTNKNKIKKQITLSTFCLSPKKAVISNSGSNNPKFNPKEKHQVQFNTLNSFKSNPLLKKGKGSNGMSSTFQVKSNKTSSRMSTSKSHIKKHQNASEDMKRKELELLYNKLRKTNIFNRNNDYEDTLNQLSLHCNETLTPKNSVSDILSSLSVIQAKVKKVDTAGALKKLYFESIPLKTVAGFKTTQQVDASLSVSKEKVMRDLLKLNIDHVL